MMLTQGKRISTEFGAEFLSSCDKYQRSQWACVLKSCVCVYMSNRAELWPTSSNRARDGTVPSLSAVRLHSHWTKELRCRGHPGLGTVRLCQCFCAVTCAQEFVRQFHFVNISLNWLEAQQFCRLHYSDLATLSNIEEMNKLQRSDSEDAWIGLRRTEQLLGGNSQWTDDSSASSTALQWTDGSSTTFTNWANNYPQMNEAACIAERLNHQWKNLNCDLPLPFFCHHDVKPSKYSLVQVSFHSDLDFSNPRNYKMLLEKQLRGSLTAHRAVPSAVTQSLCVGERARKRPPPSMHLCSDRPVHSAPVTTESQSTFQKPWIHRGNCCSDVTEVGDDVIKQSLELWPFLNTQVHECGLVDSASPDLASPRKVRTWGARETAARLFSHMYAFHVGRGGGGESTKAVSNEVSSHAEEEGAKVGQKEQKQEQMARYTNINTSVPILALFFNDGDLKPAFRLSRRTFNLLVELLPLHKDHGWKPEIEVLVTLYWLACGTSYRATADIFGMPLSTVCRVVHRIVEKMMELLPKVIHFPKAEDLEEVGRAFAQLGGHNAFRRAVGAIDGCHVRIVPPAAQKQCYFNRKLFPSIVLQGVCDANNKFLDIYVGNVGSVHDALVLRRSPMYKGSLYPPQGCFLLGDGGYPCIQHPITIVTPYRQPVACGGPLQQAPREGQKCYRAYLWCAQNALESHLPAGLEIRPTFAPKVVGACCLLHNLCVDADDLLEVNEAEEDGRDAEEEDPAAEGRELSGSGLRATLSAEVSAPQVLAACLVEHDYI
ncbi:hypothetical protein WMY93_026336 [Mugilogobius chulae]|uniref:C-type lectin domain-containing protein n=1 Tax=Mugilogobius chulae TaxID=88201 RepID=A0AAW0N905_9GOBI